MSTSARRQLLELLHNKAYQEGEFHLSSNRESKYYVDAKQVMLDPKGINLVGQVIFEILRKHGNIQAVGGPTLGAVPIAVAVAGYGNRVGVDIPAFFVRKESKKHGLKRYTEGPLPPEGARVAVVDDVVTSGKSVLTAVDQLLTEGCTIGVVICLVDRLEGARERITDRGYPFECAFTVPEIREAGRTSATVQVA